MKGGSLSRHITVHYVSFLLNAQIVVFVLLLHGREWCVGGLSFYLIKRTPLSQSGTLSPRLRRRVKCIADNIRGHKISQIGRSL